MPAWVSTLAILMATSGASANADRTDLRGFGAAASSIARDVGWLTVTVSSEAEWGADDIALVPIDAMASGAIEPLPWFRLYLGVAASIVIEQVGASVTNLQTSLRAAMAVRAGVSVALADRVGFQVDTEYGITVGAEATPELIVEVGPTLSF